MSMSVATTTIFLFWISMSVIVGVGCRQYSTASISEVHTNDVYSLSRTLRQNLFVLNGSCVWIVTADGQRMLRSNDGGSTWKTNSLNLDPAPSDRFFFSDETTGWLLAGEQGNVWRTADGGMTWSLVGRIESRAGKRYYKSTDMYFKNSTLGWIVDAFAVWQTTDGGENWESIIDVDHTVARIGQPLKILPSGGEGLVGLLTTKAILILDHKGVSKSIGFAEGFTPRNIFAWSDTFWILGDSGLLGGTTLDLLNPEKESRFETLKDKHVSSSTYFLTPRVGWVAGGTLGERPPFREVGLLLWTSDGGRTWNEQEFPAERLLEQVKFDGEQKGWLEGNRFIYSTSSGWNEWKRVIDLETGLPL